MWICSATFSVFLFGTRDKIFFMQKMTNTFLKYQQIPLCIPQKMYTIFVNFLQYLVLADIFHVE